MKFIFILILRLEVATQAATAHLFLNKVTLFSYHHGILSIMPFAVLFFIIGLFEQMLWNKFPNMMTMQEPFFTADILRLFSTKYYLGKNDLHLIVMGRLSQSIDTEYHCCRLHILHSYNDPDGCVCVSMVG